MKRSDNRSAHAVAPSETPSPPSRFLLREERQNALTRVAQSLDRAGADEFDRWVAAEIRGYVRASDQPVAVHNDASPAIGWLVPFSHLTLIVSSQCDDREVIETLLAALAAMNDVSLALPPVHRARRAGVLATLCREIGGALDLVDPAQPYDYVDATTIYGLIPGALVPYAGVPTPLDPIRTDDDRIARLALLSRVRQVSVR